MKPLFDRQYDNERECNDCGEVFNIDDLNTDWLCVNCEKQHCALCNDKYPVSELKENNIGKVCEDCENWLQEERKDFDMVAYANELLESVNVICNDYKPKIKTT